MTPNGCRVLARAGAHILEIYMCIVNIEEGTLSTNGLDLVADAFVASIFA